MSELSQELRAKTSYGYLNQVVQYNLYDSDLGLQRMQSDLEAEVPSLILDFDGVAVKATGYCRINMTSFVGRLRYPFVVIASDRIELPPGFFMCGGNMATVCVGPTTTARLIVDDKTIATFIARDENYAKGAQITRFTLSVRQPIPFERRARILLACLWLEADALT